MCSRLGPLVERAVIRVHQIRSSQPSKDYRKMYEYLVDEIPTWITEHQLRVSLSPKLLSELEGNYLSDVAPVWTDLKNRSLTDHVSSSVFSLSLEPGEIHEALGRDREREREILP
jgi:hypothetical protein